MNPFQKNPNPNKIIETKYFGPKDNLIIEYSERDKVVPGNDEYDFRIDKEVYESKKVNRQEYINSFKDDVGVLNILKKVALTGDLSLINQSNHPTGDKIIDVDDSIDSIDAMNKYDKAQASFNAIPVELRGNMSIEQFLDKFSSKDIIEYYQAKQEQTNANIEVKEDK